MEFPEKADGLFGFNYYRNFHLKCIIYSRTAVNYSFFFLHKKTLLHKVTLRMKYEECQISYMDETGYLFFFNNATEIFVLNFFFLLRLHKILGNYQGKINSLCVFICFFSGFQANS